MDRRLGVGRPPGFPFTLNNAVDTLLKKEFDIHRVKASTHPLLEKYGVDAVPFEHKDLPKWRMNFTGIQYLHASTNFLVIGAIDDIWKGKDGKLIIVDYKATATEGEITLDAEYRSAYKRQMEIYQWLFRQNGFDVSDTGYFVYANGQTDRHAFDGKLEFDVRLLKYTGNDGWVSGMLKKIKECLMDNTLPTQSADCEYCNYRNAAKSI